MNIAKQFQKNGFTNEMTRPCEMYEPMQQEIQKETEEANNKKQTKKIQS